MKIIQIGADWCPPCKRALEFYKPITDRKGVEYEYINLGGREDFKKEFTKIKKKYKLPDNVRGIPVILYEDDTKLEFLFGGFNAPSKFEEYLDDLIK